MRDSNWPLANAAAQPATSENASLVHRTITTEVGALSPSPSRVKRTWSGQGTAAQLPGPGPPAGSPASARLHHSQSLDSPAPQQRVQTSLFASSAHSSPIPPVSRSHSGALSGQHGSPLTTTPSQFARMSAPPLYRQQSCPSSTGQPSTADWQPRDTPYRGSPTQGFAMPATAPPAAPAGSTHRLAATQQGVPQPATPAYPRQPGGGPAADSRDTWVQRRGTVVGRVASENEDFLNVLDSMLMSSYDDITGLQGMPARISSLPSRLRTDPPHSSLMSHGTAPTAAAAAGATLEGTRMIVDVQRESLAPESFHELWVSTREAYSTPATATARDSSGAGGLVPSGAYTDTAVMQYDGSSTGGHGLQRQGSGTPGGSATSAPAVLSGGAAHSPGRWGAVDYTGPTHTRGGSHSNVLSRFSEQRLAHDLSPAGPARWPQSPSSSPQLGGPAGSQPLQQLGPQQRGVPQGSFQQSQQPMQQGGLQQRMVQWGTGSPQRGGSYSAAARPASIPEAREWHEDTAWPPHARPRPHPHSHAGPHPHPQLQPQSQPQQQRQPQQQPVPQGAGYRDPPHEQPQHAPWPSQHTARDSQPYSQGAGGPSRLHSAGPSTAAGVSMSRQYDAWGTRGAGDAPRSLEERQVEQLLHHTAIQHQRGMESARGGDDTQQDPYTLAREVTFDASWWARATAGHGHASASPDAAAALAAARLGQPLPPQRTVSERIPHTSSQRRSLEVPAAAAVQRRPPDATTARYHPTQTPGLPRTVSLPHWSAATDVTDVPVILSSRVVSTGAGLRSHAPHAAPGRDVARVGSHHHSAPLYVGGSGGGGGSGPAGSPVITQPQQHRAGVGQPHTHAFGPGRSYTHTPSPSWDASDAMVLTHSVSDAREARLRAFEEQVQRTASAATTHSGGSGGGGGGGPVLGLAAAVAAAVAARSPARSASVSQQPPPAPQPSPLSQTSQPPQPPQPPQPMDTSGRPVTPTAVATAAAAAAAAAATLDLDHPMGSGGSFLEPGFSRFLDDLLSGPEPWLEEMMDTALTGIGAGASESMGLGLAHTQSTMGAAQGQGQAQTQAGPMVGVSSPAAGQSGTAQGPAQTQAQTQAGPMVGVTTPATAAAAANPATAAATHAAYVSLEPAGSDALALATTLGPASGMTHTVASPQLQQGTTQPQAAGTGQQLGGGSHGTQQDDGSDWPLVDDDTGDRVGRSKRARP